MPHTVPHMVTPSPVQSTPAVPATTSPSPVASPLPPSITPMQYPPPLQMPYTTPHMFTPPPPYAGPASWYPAGTGPQPYYYQGYFSYSPNQTAGAGPSTPCSPFTPTAQAPSQASTEDEEKRMIIQLEGETFYLHREPTHRITEIIRGRFDGPYTSWKKIPVAVRDMWFKEFQRNFQWIPEHHHHIRINFDKRGSARLRDMLTLARRADERPDWIGDEIWGDLTAIWASAEYIQKSEENKKSRASDCEGFGRSLHSGGFIPTTEHKRRLAKKLGREPTLSELHTRTHKRRSDSSWVDLKSANVHEKYTQLKESASAQSSAEGTSLQQDEVDLWTQATGGVRKGRLYGVGSHGTTLNMPSTYNMGASLDANLQKMLEKQFEDTSVNMTKLINEHMQAIQVENRQMIHDFFYSALPFTPQPRPPAQHNQEEGFELSRFSDLYAGATELCHCLWLF